MKRNLIGKKNKETYTGIPPEKVIGHFPTFIHNDDLHLAQKFHGMSGTSDNLSVELRLRKRDGTYEYFLAK